MWREYPQISHQSEQISTHTSRVGCDSIILMLLSPEKGFLLTHPVWDVTIHGRWAEICNRISTHTSRVGCDKRFLHFFSCLNISTHTSRVGCDAQQAATQLDNLNFYSHIPCGMWLLPQACASTSFWWFLLTHPVWDVTQCENKSTFLFNFYSHIPCGMWHALGEAVASSDVISTHTSRVGCDGGITCEQI